METEYWLYPPHSFRETFCITALEAMAAKVKCLYRENGALGEVLGGRGLPINGDIINIINKSSSINLEDNREFAIKQTWKSRAELLTNTIISNILKGK